MQVDLEQLLTTNDLCVIFGKTAVTIMNWRKFKALPFLTLGGGDRPAVRFQRPKIRAWAKSNNVAIINDVVLNPKPRKKRKLKNAA